MGSDSEFDPSSGSDMEDPDSIEVPGGGKSLKDIQNSPSSSYVPTSKSKVSIKEKVELPTVDINPISIINSPLPSSNTGTGNLPGSSSTSNPYEKYAHLSAYELANTPIPDDFPITPVHFFRYVLPFPFVLKLCDQLNKRETTTTQLTNTMNLCMNPNYLQILMNLVMNQDGMLQTAIGPRYTLPGIETMRIPTMSPAELFKFFGKSNDLFKLIKS